MSTRSTDAAAGVSRAAKEPGLLWPGPTDGTPLVRWSVIGVMQGVGEHELERLGGPPVRARLAGGLQLLHRPRSEHHHMGHDAAVNDHDLGGGFEGIDP